MDNNADVQGDTLQEYPCDYQFKAFGPAAAQDDFFRRVHSAVDSVVPLALDACKQRLSAKGSYMCVSVLVRLHNEEQRQNIYRALQQLEGLKYLL